MRTHHQQYFVRCVGQHGELERTLAVDPPGRNGDDCERLLVNPAMLTWLSNNPFNKAMFLQTTLLPIFGNHNTADLKYASAHLPAFVPLL
jgi:hypothetical protein